MRFEDNQSDDEIIAAVRLRSQRFVQIVFCAFTVLFAALALIAHHAPEMIHLADAEPRQIADTFLVLAAAYAVCLFVWEKIYAVRD
jgi:flagellar biosynthesis protein FlhB